MARSKNWDLNLLIPLEALLTECNVTRAAQRLFLSQPAMSNTLARLRQHFDDPLLVREGRAMRRTARGEDLLRQVHQLLKQVDQLAPADFDPAAAERCFPVMMSDFASAVIMPSVLRAIADYEHISIRAVPYQATYAEGLEEGAIDLLLTIEDHLIPHHPAVPLVTQKWVVIASSDNPYIGEDLTADQYLKMRHVVVRYDDGRLPTMEEAYVQSHAIDRRVAMYVPSFMQVPWAVQGTDYLGVMPEGIAESVRGPLRLRTFPAPDGLPPIREFMQWHERTDGDKAVGWLRSLILAGVESI